MVRFVAILAVGFAFLLTDTNAKRGCSAFGHSCYGGHGKRSGDSAPGSMSEEFPSSDVNFKSERSSLLPGDSFIPVRDGGIVAGNYGEETSDEQADKLKLKLRDLLKNWIASYRRNPVESNEVSNERNRFTFF